ncbi:Serpin I2 [Cichlidogyrus casuarinus]|uniref:Serpin I2 n=1 Tax=Cichlidogyrus casuarinus TaxID=1844966 RepID=A0ABD2PV18_9PLAT
MCVKQPSEVPAVKFDANLQEIASSGSQTVYSPLSLLVLLASLLGAKGPQGDTELQLRDGFLALQNRRDDNLASFDMGEEQCGMPNTSNEDSPPSFCVANSMIVSDRFEKSINRSFIEKPTKVYKFKYSTFSQNEPEKTVNEVNTWIAKSTDGNIKNFLQAIDPNTVMMLINTLHFRGK